MRLQNTLLFIFLVVFIVSLTLGSTIIVSKIENYQAQITGKAATGRIEFTYVKLLQRIVTHVHQIAQYLQEMFVALVRIKQEIVAVIAIVAQAHVQTTNVLHHQPLLEMVEEAVVEVVEVIVKSRLP